MQTYKWKQVKHIPALCVEWKPDEDILDGQQEEGDPNIDGARWQIEFSDSKFDLFMI